MSSDQYAQDINKCIICRKYYRSGFISEEGICGLCETKQAKKKAIIKKRCQP